jgi:hypothetical protein
MTKDEKSIRQAVADRFREMVEGQKVFKLPALAQAVTRELAQRPDFARKFVETMAYGAIYDICQSVLSGMRVGACNGFHFNEKALREKQQVKVSIVANHWEYDGSEYHLLIDLTREIGRKAIAHRQKSIETEQRTIELLERLIAPLKARQTIGKHWSLKQIEQIWDELSHIKSKEKVA